MKQHFLSASSRIDIILPYLTNSSYSVSLSVGIWLRLGKLVTLTMRLGSSNLSTSRSWLFLAECALLESRDFFFDFLLFLSRLVFLSCFLSLWALGPDDDVEHEEERELDELDDLDE
ncbi:hypothetical protein BpHYR1_035626 [Brachionus plicatilis]|uniref:Uncharacterized protein n=1 Tax=Brachionus plicatilis TaxID=10195 RepID=A0A3M7RPV8_BRAPC|nr:hypothetical protein BpHYR1_035626 [Brachionus plicatilis]